MTASLAGADPSCEGRQDHVTVAVGTARRILLRASDESRMLHDICDAFVAGGVCTTAWIGLLLEDGDTLHPTARAGQGGVLAALDSHVAAGDGGCGPTATALRTARTVVVRELEQTSGPGFDASPADARPHGVQAVCALPLHRAGEMLGALTLLDAHALAFDASEVALLNELAEDLACAIHALRARAAEQRDAHRLQLVDRALRTLSAGNRTLTRCTEEAQLLAEMCRLIVEVGGYRLAWVSHAQDDGRQAIVLMAQAGLEHGQLNEVDLKPADTPKGQRSVGIVRRRGKPHVRLATAFRSLDHPYREKARESGIAAVSAFPLIVDDEAVGDLNIGAGDLDAFGEAELATLGELAEDLSFGISNLRMRARHRDAERTIEQMAFVDPLTGLPNRTRLRERLEGEIEQARRQHQPLALLTVNVDRFRDINDVLGFDQGDKLLVELAKRLQALIEPRGIVARVGVDEFSLLLPGGGAEQADGLAREVARSFDEPFEVAGARVEVQASIGIALFPGHGADPESLIMRSGSAMYQAKRGRAGIAVFHGDSELENRERLSLMAELRSAIAENQLRLYCQPKADMPSGRVRSAEALVRWVHPERGLIMPDRFIPLAERTGLINPLTYWVLNAALGQSYAWREEGVELPLAVNLSARNLLDPRLLDRLAGLIATWGAKPEWLQFELTESALMQDPAGALDVLQRLSDMGFRLYVDDFGTGYSSLSYLQKLPIDAVKIDKSFVLGMQSDTDSGIIVRSTIEMAHHIGLEVVAEGTENRSLWDQLTGFGADVAQGSYISEPIPVGQFRDWSARFAARLEGVH
jgi:diguanylate cyclase (GGDEF)-like protein